MFYILASDYNKKLHHHITSRGMRVEYIKTLDHRSFNVDDTVIVDILCQETELMALNNEQIFRCICMGDENRLNGKTIYISKYQAIEVISSQIFDHPNRFIIIVGDESLFRKILIKYPNCNYIDFSYNPESDLSLINILDMCETDLLKSMENSKDKILYPITNLMDLLDPPISFIKPMIDTLKKCRDTIVHIDQIKGPLDMMLLNQSDMIIIVHEKIENRTKRFDSSMKKIMSDKKIISLCLSTKTYDQFTLSEHML